MLFQLTSLSLLFLVLPPAIIHFVLHSQIEFCKHYIYSENALKQTNKKINNLVCIKIQDTQSVNLDLL